MDIQMLTRFFMWCTILNTGLLMFSFLYLAFAGNFVYRMHSKLFPMPRETFNVVPWAVLTIIR